MSDPTPGNEASTASSSSAERGPISRAEILQSVAIVFVVGGLGLYFVLQPILLMGYPGAVATERWPTTSGTVLGSRLDVHEYGNASGGARHRRFRVFVEYGYTVDGRRLRSRHVSYRWPYFESHSRAEAEAFLARYPVEREVVVHFDPENPSSSVLVPGAEHVNRAGRWRLAALLLALAAGVAVKDGLRWWRSRG